MTKYAKNIVKVFFLSPIIVSLQVSIPQVLADPPGGLKKRSNHLSEVEMVPWVRTPPVTHSPSQVEVTSSSSAIQSNSLSTDSSSSHTSSKIQSPEGDQGESRDIGSHEAGVNVVPEDSYFMAVESEELSREYRYLFMSDDELRATRDYALFKNDHNQFLIGIDNTVKFRAEVYCRLRGYASVVGFDLEYLQADQFKENQMFRAGWYFEFDPVVHLSRANWEFSRTGKGIEKTIKEKGFKQCPHLVFKKINCTGVFVPPDLHD